MRMRLAAHFASEAELCAFIRGFPDRVELPFPELADVPPEDVLLDLCLLESVVIKRAALAALWDYRSLKVRTFLISVIESDLDVETRWRALDSCYRNMAIADDIPMLVAMAENPNEDSDFRTTAYLAICDMAKGHQPRAKGAAAAQRRLNKNRELYEALHKIAQDGHPLNKKGAS